MVCTAALSPASATAREVLEVDVVGIATTTDIFEYYIVDGASVVYVAGIAGSLARLSTDFEQHLVRLSRQLHHGIGTNRCRCVSY